MRTGLINELGVIATNAAIAMTVGVPKPHTLAVTINGTVHFLIGKRHSPPPRGWDRRIGSPALFVTLNGILGALGL
jgi:hypothetical protein